ncbi:EamA family transporter [Desulfomicrobium escambiense]|uniref:EamA family transporter n=1 Tax=Desulfomicrobium escambiense TaxID=29503 RepID=UPI000A049A1D|nr:EamA family transporter [Desulfomicrobium escambiense]
MNLSQTILILFTVLSLSLGQILFKLAAEKINFSLAGILSLFNINLLVALLVYFFATGMWLFVLKQIPLRIAYPYAALAFIFVPLLGHFIIGEKIYWNTFVGASLILVGVLISSLK